MPVTLVQIDDIRDQDVLFSKFRGPGKKGRRNMGSAPTRMPSGAAYLGKGRVDAAVGSALDIFGGELPYDDVAAWSRRSAA